MTRTKQVTVIVGFSVVLFGPKAKVSPNQVIPKDEDSVKSSKHNRMINIKGRKEVD